MKFGFKQEEMAEQTRGQYIKTGFPVPSRRYRLHYEGYNISIEEPYFYILHYLRYYAGFPTIGTQPTSAPPPQTGTIAPTGTSGQNSSGTNIPGFNIGSFNVPGVSVTGSQPGNSPLSSWWSGQGGIPTTLDPNLIEQENATYTSSLAKAKADADAAFQAALQGISGVQGQALAAMQAAQTPENATALGALQRRRATYDPYYGRAGMPTPTEVNPAPGTFGIPLGSPGGVGLRWALLSPQQQFNAVNEPLGVQRSIIQSAISAMNQGLADKADIARIIYEALKNANPKKDVVSTPSGPVQTGGGGIVSGNSPTAGGKTYDLPPGSIPGAAAPPSRQILRNDGYAKQSQDAVPIYAPGTTTIIGWRYPSVPAGWHI